MHNVIITDKQFILTNMDSPDKTQPLMKYLQKLQNTFLLTHKLWYYEPASYMLIEIRLY